MGNAESAAFPFKVGTELPTRYPNSIWKLYDGTRLANGEQVSIFTFTKTGQPESHINAAKNALLKLKTLRYPTVIKYIDGVELTSTIHIVTEPVVPLDNVYVHSSKQTHLAVSLGLFQIASAISWINNDCKFIHNLIYPGSIYVTKSGDWKLSGFECTMKAGENVDTSVIKAVLPAAYRAPELSKGANSDVIHSADAWSIGCLIYDVYNNFTLTSPSQLSSTGNIPTSLVSEYKRLLSTNVSQRLNPNKLLTCSTFHNELVSTVNFLDQLALKSNDEKEQFFTNFVKHVTEFPSAVCKYKILPLLTSSLDYGAGLTSFSAILTSALKIGNMLSSEEYAAVVIPSVVKLFSSNERAIRVHLLQHLHEFVGNLSAELINTTIFPHVITGFTDSNPMLRELTVKSLTHFVSKLNTTHLDNSLKFLSKLQTDPEPAIRTNTTYCIAKIAVHLTPDTQQKVLVPAFSRALKDPFPPARVAAIVSFLATIDCHTVPSIACRVIPIVSPCAVDESKEVRDATLKTLNVLCTKLSAYSEKMGEKVDESVVANANGMGTVSKDSNYMDKLGVAGNVLGSLGGWAASAVSSKLLGNSGAATANTNAPTTTTANTSTSNNYSSTNTTAKSTSQPSTSRTSSVTSITSPTRESKNDADDFFDDFGDDDADEPQAVVSLSTKPKKTTTPAAKSGTVVVKKPTTTTAIKPTLGATPITSTSNDDVWGDLASTSTPSTRANVTSLAKPTRTGSSSVLSPKPASTSQSDWDFDFNDNASAATSTTSSGWGESDDWSASLDLSSKPKSSPPASNSNKLKSPPAVDNDFSAMLGTSTTKKPAASPITSDPFASLSSKPATSTASSSLSLAKKPITSTTSKPSIAAQPVSKPSAGKANANVDDWDAFLND